MEAAGKTCGVLNETSKFLKSILKRKKKEKKKGQPLKNN